MKQLIRIEPNGPLIFRDGRPFSAGSAQAVSLPFPPPSAVAGTVRTLMGTQAGFTGKLWSDTLTWTVRGPFLGYGDALYFPAPADAVWKGGRPHRLTPIPYCGECGTDLPPNLTPAGLSEKIGKPDSGPGFWSRENVEEWLLCRVPETFDMQSLERDRRSHVKIDPEMRTAESGFLFSTEGLVFEGSQAAPASSLLVEVDSPLKMQQTTHRIGGEGRFARFDVVASDLLAGPTGEFAKSLGNSNRIRLQLATPGCFDLGWLPDWIDPIQGKGCPPGAPPGLELTLRSAVVPRWQALSGWDMAADEPKTIVRLAAAGSVYFFESNGPSDWFAGDGWLAPMGKDVQRIRDGYGLALWGIW